MQGREVDRWGASALLVAALALVASLLTPAGAAAAEPTPGSLSEQTYAYGDVFADMVELSRRLGFRVRVLERR